MDIQSKFGKTCLKLRKQLNVSQEDFSFKIGMDRTYYASVEKGKRNISLKNIQKIVNGFDISIGEFFTLMDLN